MAVTSKLTVTERIFNFSAVSPGLIRKIRTLAILQEFDCDFPEECNYDDGVVLSLVNQGLCKLHFEEVFDDGVDVSGWTEEEAIKRGW